MKSKIKWFPVIIVLCIACVRCTGYDDYKKYMPEGEIIYPQKADSVKTFPGRNRIQLEWVIIDPKVTSCKIIYEQAGIKDSMTVSISGNSYENDTVRVIIPNLEEVNYRFKIISYDDFGHASIPAETEEQAYGEMYENSLLTRVLKNFRFDENENLLQLEWYEAEATEVNTKIDYTDINGMNRTITVAASETSTTLPDFNVAEPFYYSTMYRPVPSAIDLFQTRVTRQKLSWYKDVSADKLTNYAMPFKYKQPPIIEQNDRGYFDVDGGWLYNAALGVSTNGVVFGTWDGRYNYVLSMKTYSPTPNIVNGKLYQTVELDAGNYKFTAYIYAIWADEGNVTFNAYVAAAVGSELPDTDALNSALGAKQIPDHEGGWQLYIPVTVEFALAQKSTVSLGFVATLANKEYYISSVQLMMEQ